VVYGILLRPLPYPDAGRVALVYMHFSPQNFERGTMCIADYLDWKSQNRAFDNPSLFSARRLDIAGSSDPESVRGAFVTAGFFPTLQVHPLIGRVFLPDEDQANSSPAAVISESLWRGRFASSPAVLGQAITVNGVSTTIVGVMPRAFRFPQENTALWVNLRLVPPTRRGPYFYHGIARLRPGVTLAQAQAETNAIGRRIMQQEPYYKRLTLPVVALRDALVGNVRPALLVMSGAVGLVLLIAVVNVANLTLARATVRRREMALRLSLGAGHGRLLRQLLTESVLLSAAGGAAGVALAYGGIRFLRAWNPGDFPMMDSVHLDAAPLLFTFLVALLTGVLFGLAPALQSARAGLSSTIQEGGRGSSAGSGRRRTRSTLVVAEIALSLMLLAGAGLLLRSFLRLQQVAPGFHAPPRQVLAMPVSPIDPKYENENAGIAFYDRVLDRVRNLPGVESAALSDGLPPNDQSDSDTFTILGQVLAPGELNPSVTVGIISADYFRALRIPLVRGRYFTEYDTPNSAPVVIISESLARHFFPGQDPIGRRLKESSPNLNGTPFMEIVGIVGDVKYTGLQKDTDAAYYMPFRQDYGRRMYVVVRAAGSAAGLTETLRREVRSIDPGVIARRAFTLEESLSDSVALPRFDTMLLALFAGLALLLAAIGLYGLMAYSVARRTHEIGVRMALGARAADVTRMVLQQAVGLALLGIAAGLAGAFALTRLLSALLFGTSATDAVTFAAVSLLLLAVSLLASFLPALRATRISPVVALRYD
jgi:putative ABC transport system permease protein